MSAQPVGPFAPVEPSARPLIVGFIKVRNEIVREGNIYRAIKNMQAFCDTIVACDDGSTDGTREYLQSVIPAEQLVLVPHAEQDFRNELYWKQQMLNIVHRLQPYWIWWQDADEELSADGIEQIRQFCLARSDGPEGGGKQEPHCPAWRVHYTQFWRSAAWARTDNGFDDGSYIKLWRWTPELSFDVKYGTHFYQFPKQLERRVNDLGKTPWELFHWGNYGKNLVWKCVQYHGGLGGVKRHIDFSDAEYRPVGVDDGHRPQPFTAVEQRRILELRNLHGIEKMFTVVVPTFNRADKLGEALQSLLQQTYERWVAVVIDDGSTDKTPEVMRKWQERDPRIFYCRFDTNRGGVAANEVGMSLAVDWTEWWTRLGSDDWFEPRKLELDAEAFASGCDAVYGCYRVLRNGQLAEMCGNPEDVNGPLMKREFRASWANCAVKTSLLQTVRATYGNFCDPRLRNMEDYLVNQRLARHGKWSWRGVTEAGRVVIGATDKEALGSGLVHDAIWRVGEDGASGPRKANIMAQDESLTRQLMLEEMLAWSAKNP